MNEKNWQEHSGWRSIYRAVWILLVHVHWISTYFWVIVWKWSRRTMFICESLNYHVNFFVYFNSWEICYKNKIINRKIQIHFTYGTRNKSQLILNLNSSEWSDSCQIKLCYYYFKLTMSSCPNYLIKRRMCRTIPPHSYRFFNETFSE